LRNKNHGEEIKSRRYNFPLHKREIELKNEFAVERYKFLYAVIAIPTFFMLGEAGSIDQE